MELKTGCINIHKTMQEYTTSFAFRHSNYKTIIPDNKDLELQTGVLLAELFTPQFVIGSGAE